MSRWLLFLVAVAAVVSDVFVTKHAGVAAAIAAAVAAGIATAAAVVAAAAVGASGR